MEIWPATDGHLLQSPLWVGPRPCLAGFKNFFQPAKHRLPASTRRADSVGTAQVVCSGYRNTANLRLEVIVVLPLGLAHSFDRRSARRTSPSLSCAGASAATHCSSKRNCASTLAQEVMETNNPPLQCVYTWQETSSHARRFRQWSSRGPDGRRGCVARVDAAVARRQATGKRRSFSSWCIVS